MYIVLGSTLEYVREADKVLIVPIIAAFGILKIVVGIYDHYIDIDLEEI
jgi:hypothetical protein